ncbi:MAG: hypothetical protein OIF57_17220 [Marinobacterium sp.]|nr:hypothetical protein [Marinobacterium sp.]
MISAETKWLLPALLVAGGVLAMLVLVLVQYRVRRALRVVDQIYALNQQGEQDLLFFLSQLGEILVGLDNFSGLRYQVHWYGQTLSGSVGITSSWKQTLSEQHDQVQLELTLYWQRRAVGERWIFQEVLLRTLTLLVRMNVLLKQQSQVQAQLRASQGMLFLRHDVKNLAQFIQLQNGMLKGVEYPVPEKVLQRLIRSSALAQRQADEILLRMQPGDDSLLPVETFALGAFCRHKAEAFGIAVTVQGEAMLTFPPSVLDTVLENLYANALQHGGVHYLALTITDAPVTLSLLQQSPVAPPLRHRIFEPLASQTGDRNRGVGMYHCRQLLNNYKGNIEVTCTDNDTLFKLSFK